jgi:DNA-binding PadR family transcriptional regulator
MRYNIYVNQVKLKEFGIRNINQAHILGLLLESSTWAEEIIYDDKVYYWVARQKICEELWILDIKPDTAYRHLKKLADYGLIDYIKIGKKDCIRLTEKGKTYNSKHYVGNESEKDTNSEMNPTKLGNESEKDSDLNPTYNNTIHDNLTNNTFSQKNTFEAFIEDLKKEALIKSRVTITKEGKKLFKDFKGKEEELKQNYLEHQKEKGQYAKRITAYMLDYEFETTYKQQSVGLNNISEIDYSDTEKAF